MVGLIGRKAASQPDFAMYSPALVVPSVVTALKRWGNDDVHVSRSGHFLSDDRGRRVIRGRYRPEVAPQALMLSH